MNETEFTHNLKDLLKNKLPEKYIVEEFANLYYQLTINNKLELEQHPKIPKRGNSAFQTDILISEKRGELIIPKVVIELKGGLSTHDVITYSSKAVRHKKVYPYLRYGLLSYALSSIPKRFFIHNEGMDFFIAYKDLEEKNTKLLDLIKEQIEYSDRLERNIFEKDNIDFYTTVPNFLKLD
jgi:hypothetical protein